MGSPTVGLLRGVRAGSLGVVGFVLALMAHLAAGGAAPGPVLTVVMAGLIALAAVLLTAVRLSPVRVGLSLTAMQVVLHQAFGWLGASAGCSMSGMGTSTPGHLLHGGPRVLGCATGIAQAGMAQHSMSASPAMIGAHLAATAVMAALLAYGESVLWLLAGWVRPTRWGRVGLPELFAVRGCSSAALPTLPAWFVCGGVGQRGPPQGPFATV